jgi:hypothetical protein
MLQVDDDAVKPTALVGRIHAFSKSQVLLLSSKYVFFSVVLLCFWMLLSWHHLAQRTRLLK